MANELKIEIIDKDCFICPFSNEDGCNILENSEDYRSCRKEDCPLRKHKKIIVELKET